MKRISTLLLFASFASLTATAQTRSGLYSPGVTPEGVVYFLPKTAVRVTVQVERTTYTPGDLCMYAERYLRLRDVSADPSVVHRLIAIRQEPLAMADTARRYAVKFDARTAASNIALSDDGVLLTINADGKPTARQAETGRAALTGTAARPATNPRQYMSEEILAAGSTAKMAELTAQDIYEIRESRNLLVRGQADYMPKDGEQLRLMLSQLEQQDRALTSLFAGVTVSDTTERTFIVVPDQEIRREVLFRFSQRLGLLDHDDLAGTPYYISIEDLHAVPQPAPVDPKKRDKQVPGIYVNVPGKMRSTILSADGPLLTSEFPAGQFGNVELLSGALFNKHYTTHLWLHPISGAVEKLEVEQPR